MNGRQPRRLHGMPGAGRYDLDGIAPDSQPDRLLQRPLVEARTSLCDVLDALADHRGGLVVIGSHAVHERTRLLGIVSTTTKDSDLAVVPSLVEATPKIEDVMRGAGFRPLGEFPDAPSRFRHQPGLWGRGFAPDGSPVAEVDLIVPGTLAGGGRRSPRSMAEHGKMATRFSDGVDLAAVDHDLMLIESFANGSVREANVAGTAALLCAKAYKLGERVTERDAGGRNRVTAKDGSDLWRLMAASDPPQVAHTFRRLLDDDSVGAVARTGLDHLRTIVTSGEVSGLAEDDLADAVDPDEVREVHDHWISAFFAEFE